MDYGVVFGAKVGTPEAVSLEDAKNNSVIEDTSNDTFLQKLLNAAVKDAENYTGHSILERNVAVTKAAWPGSQWIFPTGLIKSIETIKYFDSADQEQTLADSAYSITKIEQGVRSIVFFDPDTALPVLSTKRLHPITFNLICGFATADVPDDLKDAIMMRFSHREQFREDMPQHAIRSFELMLQHYKLYNHA